MNMAKKIVKTDLDFIKEIMANGGDSVNKCYQCATCSVVCNLSPDNSPFPRKEMVMAQWGMKDALLKDADIWLCHQCADCTAYCPRGAKPGDVLGALRKITIEEYAPVKFLASLVSKPAMWPFAFLLPVVILLIDLMFNGKLKYLADPQALVNMSINGEPESAGKIVFAKLFPTVTGIDIFFMTAAIFAVVCFWIGLSSYWKALNSERSYPVTFKGSIIGLFAGVIWEALTSIRFKLCNTMSVRSTTHLIVFWSFVGLALTTATASVYEWVLRYPSPYPLYDPVKILGNVSGIALVIGSIWMINTRSTLKVGANSGFDWLLLIVVAGLGLTGMGAEIFRLMNLAGVAYWTYFIHLTFVMFLFIYAPFFKIAHLAYRTLALAYTNLANRGEPNALKG